MAKFRCPRCGAVVEGLHDRCPRCNVLFKYRKEDIELLTPYESPITQPERIEEKPAQEPLPVEKKEEVLPPAPVEEAKVEEKAKPEEDLTKNNKAKKTSFIFGLIGFILTFFGFNIIPIVFGGVALGQAKKAKPVKATGGKVFGILDIIFGVIGLLMFIAFASFVSLVILGIGGFVIATWINPDIWYNFPDLYYYIFGEELPAAMALLAGLF